jgi:hypothetical protein
VNNLITQLKTYTKIDSHIKINLQTIGKLSVSLLICFILGLNTGNLTNAASSSSVLSVAKGGTGANTLSSGQALIGNGANNIQTKAIDASPQANSTNLITSGAAFSNTGLQNLNKADILTTSEYFDMNFTTQNPSVRKVGNIMVISGPFKVIKKVPTNAKITIFTIKSGFHPFPYTAVSCSNNFYGAMHAGTVPPVLDCVCNGPTLAVQASSNGLDINTYVDLNFIYMLP